MQTKTLDEQALDYVNRVGLAEARQSNHYLTAVRHCKCNNCFCCAVRKLVDSHRPKSCQGCQYDKSNPTRGCSETVLCTHPKSADAGFWADVNDYSCHTPLKP